MDAEVTSLLRRAWSGLDAWRSRDARRMGPELRDVQDQIGKLLRALPADAPPPRERTGEDALRDAAATDRIYQEQEDRWERPGDPDDWGQPPDYGGADDGISISSDADPGL